MANANQNNDLIDYAMPCMTAERELKAVHEQVLRKNYEFALQHAKKAMVECKLLQNAIKHMMETDDAYQSPSK